ncbi:MAG: hypothetical protein A3E84_00330 [Gammaproteobacteria bacterium RIFCSPHIGHO2_12_FULL_42_13]|nr:MAG: hypothetical protein A3E84_00330 [Gammaproteobacteria bacterium RIFCSPHIGHO2_12_FULL_42_13]
MKGKQFFLLLLLFVASLSSAALRDPTRPIDYTAASAAPQGVQVTAILVRDQQFTAFVNGQWHVTGDTVSGYEITRITADHLYLTNNKGNYVVSLVPVVTRSKTP